MISIHYTLHCPIIDKNFRMHGTSDRSVWSIISGKEIDTVHHVHALIYCPKLISVLLIQMLLKLVSNYSK